MKIIAILTLSLIFVISCKKTVAKPVVVTDQEQLKKDILSNLSSNVINPCYSELMLRSEELYMSIQDFSTDPTDAKLLICRDKWRTTRNSWERSEGFLFGPVSANNIDPRIDSWPINYLDIEMILGTTTTLSTSYVDGLEDGLKGFHVIEYLLWGADGTKVASIFTVREKEFLNALSFNLKTLCAEVKNSWDPSGVQNYTSQFNNAGNGSLYYTTQLQVYEEVINAMIGICDEVGTGKIGETFTMQDPSLEESPFAKNSITDFTNNMKSVQHIYLGQYNVDGLGIEDIIRSNNSSMDSQIKFLINNAILSLNNITVDFGTAITTQGVQVQNSINAIGSLKSYLEDSVLPFTKTLVQ